MGRRSMNQAELFDVARTTTAQCATCGATRQPTEPTAPACAYDRDRQAGTTPRRRPHNCLNTYDPTTAPFPEGY